jgi:hypothetical protein
VNKNPNTLPYDYKNPDWTFNDNLYCWRNHIPEETQRIWDSLSVKEKKTAALKAKREALAMLTA